MLEKNGKLFLDYKVLCYVEIIKTINDKKVLISIPKLNEKNILVSEEKIVKKADLWESL